MLNSMTVWLPGWKKKGWKTASGSPVKNQDLIMALEAEVNRLGSVRWHWVRGHETGAGNEHKALNDRADQLEPALDPGAPGEPERDGLVEPSEAVTAVGARDRRADLGQREPPAERRLVQVVRDLLRDQDIGEVNGRPRDRRDGDPEMRGDITWIEAPALLDEHALHRAAVARDDHCDDRSGPAPGAPGLGRREAAEG